MTNKMKKSLLIIAGILASCNSAQKTVTPSEQQVTVKSVDPVVYAETITEGELKDHLYIYASDEFEGRETGEPGQKKAIAYLKTAYEKLGIPPAKKDGDYFQKVPLEVSKLPVGKLILNNTDYLQGEHVLTFNAADFSDDEIVYVGYGVEEDTYSDYKGMDLMGKIVLVKSGEPKNTDGTYKLSGTEERSMWSNMSESLGKRIELAKDKGARGVLYYDDSNFSRFKRRFDYMRTNDSGRMSLKDNASGDFSSIFIDKTMAKAIFPKIAENHTPSYWKQRFH
jgi:hypothetical protein